MYTDIISKLWNFLLLVKINEVEQFSIYRIKVFELQNISEQ